ncbi:glycine--tRNA ligase [Candidatus Gracilibacteria bacterium]|nr:glycine--tRNA ligase [Candidatus Gracilibacteria bacterium]NJS41125.1 glycine--tRNA ligase [Candidatus Gracilibacteria bacterium]
MSNIVSLDELAKFARRKGFIYQGSEIYGGLANTWDYGNKGVLLKENIKNLWRQYLVQSRVDMIELDSGILMNQRVWEASGHTETFADAMVDDKKTKHRFRADHLIEEQLGIDVEGMSGEEITKIMSENKLLNPKTGKEGDWTEARYMNLMFETNRDKINPSNEETRIYLRPETAQGIFVQFKNILNTERKKLPFGVGQIGKAFRNEITPGNFNFRIVEFEQMEIEYFITPPSKDKQWNKVFEEWLDLQKKFLKVGLALTDENLQQKEHSKEKLSHYSKRTVDLEYNFPFGFSELTGLAYRTDFDLSQHMKFSGESLEYMDPTTGEKFIPHVIEPTVGVDRLFLAILCQHYREEKIENDTRIVLGLPYKLAPFKVAVLPLMKKDGLGEKAQEIFANLRARGLMCDYDESGSVGKRYRRQDENGTPWCLTVDYDTLSDGTITLRHRDTMEQERVKIDELSEWLDAKKF